MYSCHLFNKFYFVFDYVCYNLLSKRTAKCEENRIIVKAETAICSICQPLTAYNIYSNHNNSTTYSVKREVRPSTNSTMHFRHWTHGYYLCTSKYVWHDHKWQLEPLLLYLSSTSTSQWLSN